MGKLTTVEVNQRLAPRGIKQIGKWLGRAKKNSFRCPNGHTWQAEGKSVLKGRGCPHCYKLSFLTKAEVNRRLAPRGLQLKGEWHGLTERNEFVCAAGHVWEAIGTGPVTSGRGCSECYGLERKLTTTEVNERLYVRGIALVGEWQGGVARHTFSCMACNNTWETVGKSVLVHGNGCPHCNVFKFPKLTRDEVVTRLEAHGLELVGDWHGKRKSNRYKCRLGHEWETTGADTLNGRSGCPECFRLRHINSYTRPR